MEAETSPQLDERLTAGPSPLRVGVWVLHVALPLFGLWLLLAKPEADIRWEHHVAHFWLITGVAALNVALALLIARASYRRDDARLFLVSMTFLTAAGFLVLHALATPQVVLSGKNAGFVFATPVGLCVAAVFAAASALDLSGRTAEVILRFRRQIIAAVAAILVVWAVVSMLEVPPLDRPPSVDETNGWFAVTGAIGIALYAAAAILYHRISLRRPSAMLLSLITACVLLAEALFAATLARNWQASWWEWHLLMAAGFAFVAYAAQTAYWHEGSAAGIFNSIALQETLRHIREEHAEALEGLVSIIQRRVDAGDDADEDREIARGAANLRARFGLTEAQVQVLERAAQALAAERDQIRRLNGLVELGRRARVHVDEDQLIATTEHDARVAAGRHDIRIGLLRDGSPHFVSPSRFNGSRDIVRRSAIDRALESGEPTEAEGAGVPPIMALPLVVKDRPVGVIEVARASGRFTDRDRALLESLAAQLSVAIENARLYRQIDALFRSYMSPDIAQALIADPSQAALGGSVAEITVLFADLRGFTSFSERSSPEAVVDMLNRSFGAAAPIVLAEGGTVTQFVGDALMAIFNVPVAQPDHALRAARAALEMQRAVEEIASERAGSPRFRVGINTGEALVGNIGSAELRHYTAIGDTVNLASRLETSAEPGQIVISASTAALLGHAAIVEPLPPIILKGKELPVEAFVLRGLAAVANR